MSRKRQYPALIAGAMDSSSYPPSFDPSFAVSSGSPYSAQAQAYFARMLSQPSTDWKGKADTLIRGLITDGLFAQLAALYLFNVEAFGQELPNAISASYTMTPLGGLTLTPHAGIASNGSSGYYDTNFPFVSANPFSVGVFVTASALGQPSLTGDLANASMVCDIVPTSGGTAVAIRLGMSNLLTWANVTPTGHFAVTRLGGTVAGYQDGAQKATISATNFALPGDNLLWMRRNAIYTTAQFGASFFAQAAISAADLTALHARLATFLASVT